MDRLTGLTVFIQVVDSGGFSAAARRLGMSTTAVSNHVQALEHRLGTRLLIRTTRSNSVTEFGKSYYERCKQILADLEQADEMARGNQPVPRGTLRVHATTDIARFVAPLAASFLTTFPHVKFDLTVGEVTVDPDEEGFDIAIQVRGKPEVGLIVHSLSAWPRELCCSPAYLQKSGPLDLLSDLSRQNCLRRTRHSDELWSFTDRHGAPASVRVDGNLFSNNMEVLRSAAVQGVGVLLAPNSLIAAELDSGRLVRLLPEFRPVEFPIVAVYSRRRRLSGNIASFLTFVARQGVEQQKAPSISTALVNPSAGSLLREFADSSFLDNMPTYSSEAIRVSRGKQ